MPTPRFLFSMRLAGRDHGGRVMEDVAARVFRYVGWTSSAIDELVQALNAVVGPGAGSGEEVEVQFRARDGSCEVVVRFDNREVWRTSRRLP